MKAKLIGITGKAGAGKDSLADAMVQEFGAVKHNFALPLKQMLNVLMGWQMKDWDNREFKEAEIDWLNNTSPRKMAQYLGTEWGRNLIDPDLWVKIAMMKYHDHAFRHSEPFVIPDVRFDNEARTIRSLGGVVIRIVRPGVGAVSAHVSEAGVNDSLIDATLMNDGTLEQFLRNALGHASAVA